MGSLPEVRKNLFRQNAFDGLGLCTFGAVAYLLWRRIVATNEVRPVDLLVYHLAVGHIGADDAFKHSFPELPFTYPPSGLLLLLPAALPVALVSAALYLASAASMWITVRLVVRASAACGTIWNRVGAVSLMSALGLLTWPMTLGMSLGQVAPIVMGMTAVATLRVRPQMKGPLLLGTATALKLTPALFALFWWRIGQKRSAALAGATFLAWTAVSALIMPRFSRWYFLDGGVMAADHDYANLSNQAVSGVVQRLGAEGAAAVLATLTLSAAMLIGSMAVAVRLHSAGWNAVAVTLLGVWSGVIAPVAWIHAFGWWVPLAIAIGLTGRRRTDVAAAVLVYLLPFTLLLGGSISEPPSGTSQSPVSAAYALLACGVTIWLWWRIPSRSERARARNVNERTL